MQRDEYLKLAEVEDRMWYFRALHAHVERSLARAWSGRGNVAAGGGARPHEILDAGCGTGGLIRRMAAHRPDWRWTGLDASELACELARQRLESSARIELGDVTKLPFADGSFDAVVSADVLYHVDDDGAALREFCRVLRPGGRVVINVPAYRWLWSYHDVAVESRRRYGRDEVVAKLAAAGFGAIQATFWNTLPFPLVVARRKLLPAPAGGSDVQLYPPPIEAAFNAAMALERRWLATGARLPFGSSVFACAQTADA